MGISVFFNVGVCNIFFGAEVFSNMIQCQIVDGQIGDSSILWSYVSTELVRNLYHFEFNRSDAIHVHWPMRWRSCLVKEEYGHHSPLP